MFWKMHCFSIYMTAYQHFQCNILPLCFDFRCSGDSNKGFTYSQTAGVFGGHMEVDHILAHNDVWDPITIISNLTWSQRLQQTRIIIWHTTHWTTTPCNSATVISFYHKYAATLLWSITFHSYYKIKEFNTHRSKPSTQWHKLRMVLQVKQF